MRRAIGTFVVLALIGGAVWIGLASRTEQLDPTLSINCGLSLCAHEALIDAEVVVERCDRFEECHLVPFNISVFLGFVDLDDPGPDSCGPGDCGARIEALQSGWEPGRWKIIPPRIRRFPHLVPPEPVNITLEAGGTYEVQLVYRDPLNGWPRGPFAHNCLPENADGEGDFDGDGLRDRVDFNPGYSSEGFNGWSLRQRFGDNRIVSKLVDAECPEIIGATDVDQDGDDELFFDTGKGMTAALIDLLVYERGKLREVTYRPKSTLLYVGSSMAGRSDLRCFPTEGSPLFEILTVDEQRQRVTSTNFSLRGRVVVKTGTFPVRGDADGRLRCFGLDWTGY